MNVQKLISTAFATAAVASASIPALAWTVWPDIDFEWYANVGQTQPAGVPEAVPPPRPGHIWAPGRWVWNGRNHVWLAGHWLRDDYAEQLIAANNVPRYAQQQLPARGDLVAGLPDRDGDGTADPNDRYPDDAGRS